MSWSEVKRPIVCLAPMDGVTNSAYRQIIRSLSKDVILFSEFTSVDGLLRSEHVRLRLDFEPCEQPFFMQLFGNSPDIFAEASRMVEDRGILGVDINMGCPGDFGILVTVGTGIICISRNSEGKSIRQAGEGHDQGDVGSGYWIGRQALLNLTLNETSVLGDQDLEEIMSVFLKHVNDEEFQVAMEKLNESDDAVFIIAGLAESIIGLAEKGNEVALSIVQEATHAVSEYIIALTDELDYNESHIVLSGNGSVIRNDFFRKSLNDDLRFNFSDIKWTFSSISPAYGAGILAAKIHDVDIKVSDIVKGDALAPA